MEITMNGLVEIEFVGQMRNLLNSYIRFKEERGETPVKELYDLFVFCDNAMKCFAKMP